MERQGKIPLLHVGDTIYFIVFGYNTETEKYEDFIRNETIMYVFTAKDWLSYTTESKGFSSDEIGKTIFLTQEEVEVVLQGYKNEHFTKRKEI